jgi:hypothetical protein
LVPELKLTALSLLELDITVVLVRSELSPSKVPRPTSNSAWSWCAIQ